jgi:hypothetical protein
MPPPFMAEKGSVISLRMSAIFPTRSGKNALLPVISAFYAIKYLLE